MKSKMTIPGIIVTILATMFFIWSVYQLINISDNPHQITDGDIMNNEIKALNNLKLIIKAQNEFYSKDLDGDGIKDYVEFLPHLWTYASKDINPIKLELISEDIAFSKSSQDGYNGYVFVCLQKVKIESDDLKDIDNTKKWAAIAYPKTVNITGRLTYITNQNNDIFAKKDIYNLKLYPTNPEKEGWLKINSEEDLINLIN